MSAQSQDDMIALARTFVGAKSLCRCGHAGDGADTEHADVAGIVAGHGRCLVKTCRCRKFQWGGHTLPFKRHMKMV